MRRLVLSLLVLLTAAIIDGQPRTIVVSDSGHDTPQCQDGDGSTDCGSLDYALETLYSITDDVTITIASQNQFLNESYRFESLWNVVITANTSATVYCEKLGHGIAMSYSNNITISNINWIDCSISHDTSALGNWSCNSSDSSCDPFILPQAYSAVFLFNCTDFTLSNANFSSGRGSGVSLYNVLGDVVIEYSWFREHVIRPPVHSCAHVDIDHAQNCSVQSTGLYIEYSFCQNMTSYCPPDKTIENPDLHRSYRVHYVNYYIVGCHFEDNSNMGAYREYTDIRPVSGLLREQHWPFGRGGGLGVVLRAFEFKHLTLLIKDCVFRGNRAIYGGGMYLQLEPGFSDHTHFNITSSEFVDNTAILDGGGVSFDMNVVYHHTIVLNKRMRNYLFVNETSFQGNEAYWGGGVSLVTYPCNVSYLDIHFQSSHWNDNTHTSGAGAMGVLRKEKPEQLYYFIPDVHFTNCSFTGTKADLSLDGSLSFISCSVYSEGIQLWFHGSTLFENNCASALGLSDTGAIFYDTVLFVNNTGFNGGAMFLTGKAYMTLTPDVEVEFRDNSAYQYGGAIYYLAPPPLEMNTSGSCFVWYHHADNFNNPLENWWIDVKFIGNKATQAGDAAYISNPEKCIWPNDISLFDPSRIEKFDYSGQSADSSTHVISTPVKRSSLSYSNNSGHNSSTTVDGLPVLQLMPGDNLKVQVSTFDYYNQLAPVTLSIECHHFDRYNDSTFDRDLCQFNKSFNVDGRLVQSNTMLYNVISGLQQSNDLVLVFRACQPVSVIIPLWIKFGVCEDGYTYSNSTHRCECVSNSESINIVNPMLCVASADTNTTEIKSIAKPCIQKHFWAGKLHGDPDTLVYQYCHTSKCDFPKRCNHSTYYAFPKCIKGLSGPLCSSCENGSLTYNSHSCSQDCSIGHKVGLVLLMLLECFVVLGFILVFLKLNVRVSTASFYSLLYFYSVLPLFLWARLPLPLEVIIALISSVTSLDFTILQYLNFCLFDEVRPIHYEFIHYLYPVVTLLLIAIVIKMDNFCLRKFQFFTGNGATQALCIMLLIAYTSISETSLNILLPMFYTNASTNERIDQYYVYVDPGLKYLDVRHHLPYWLVAVIVEFGFVLPSAFLIMLAPFLMRCVNLSRIKPVLDEYHNCFYDNQRWFAGVYLLARQLLFLISMVCTSPEQMSYVQQVFCVLLLVLVATLQPYRNQWINRMDIFFLFLLTVISFSGYNATSMYTLQSEDLHNALLGTLSLLPVAILLIGLCALGIKKGIVRLLDKRSAARLQYVLANQSDTLSQNSIGDSDDTPPFLSTDSSSPYDADLPPRFYDEEQDYRTDERTRLLQSAPRRLGFTGSRYQRKYSINAPHTD